MESNLDRKTINNLCVGKDGKRLRFHIPSYQRGYRWTSHVAKLMDDIYDFTEAKNNNLNVGRYYCLQPIVIKRKPNLDFVSENGQPEIGYEVVDGQQRLTTIVILLKALAYPAEDGVFRISFERDKSDKVRETFLEDVDIIKDDEFKKADFHYIRHAYCNAKEWLKQKTNKEGSNPRQRLLTVLLEEVMVIWYELPDDSDERSHFRNINAGKIQLTEAELVKAMMLNSKHYRAVNTVKTDIHLFDETIRLKQEQIALTWDDCERTLQNDAFWKFITCDHCLRSERMDFLLKLYCREVSFSNIRISSYFESLLTDKDKILNNSNGIRELFRRIQDWFGDVSLYNYIGLLIHYRGTETKKQNTLLYLIEESAKYTKPEFRGKILNTINKEINTSPEEFNQMNYYDDKHTIKWMLMLFNIKLMNSLGRRFDFAANGGWSVEHVFALNSVKVNESDRKDWVARHLRVVESRLKDCDDKQTIEISDLRDQMIKYSDSTDFDKLFSDYLRLIETPEGDINAIGNLALLGLEENIKLQNDSFYDKRRKIIRMIEEGRNIPVGTERVFLKSFPDTGTSLDYWNIEDGKRYVSYMQKIIFEQGESLNAGSFQ